MTTIIICLLAVWAISVLKKSASRSVENGMTVESEEPEPYTPDPWERALWCRDDLESRGIRVLRCVPDGDGRLDVEIDGADVHLLNEREKKGIYHVGKNEEDKQTIALEIMKMIQTNFEDNHGVVVSGGNNRIEIRFDQNGNMTVEKEEIREHEDEKDLLNELRGCFYGESEPAAGFLEKIQGLKPTAITQIVKKMVAEREISEISAGKPLWEILNSHGFYTASLSNWYKQIK